MRRLLASFASLACVLVASVVSITPVRAQGRPGGVRPMQGADVIPPTLLLLSPGSAVTVQYPTFKIEFCDNVSLNASSRWIKVNGTDHTSDFDYQTPGDPEECELVAATSHSSTVALEVGDNTIDARICDNYGNCTRHIWTVTRVQQAAPTVTRHNFNRDNQDRSLCLTVGAGQAAGLACGDLFVVHGMPAYRTMGRDRSLTLFYSSSQATPRPTVAAWVSQPSGALTPNSVFAKLTVGGVARDSATYSAWSSANGPRQIVLAYDASGAGSRLDTFKLEVRNRYSGVDSTTTITDTLMVVDRSTSPFGAGWWLAGVEQLIPSQPGNKILWVDGDGSAAVYRPAGTNVWVRATGAYRDTLVSTRLGYTRTLRHGVQVKFDSTGRHIETVNRTGQSTRFTWDVSRLTSIRVPPGDSSGPTYSLGYDGSSKLDYIADPAGRVLNATISSGNLTQLTDPDSLSVNFGYDASHRLTSRTGRGGHPNTYAYSAASHIDTVLVQASATETDTTRMEWWDEKGLAIGSPGNTLSAVDTGSVFSKVYGPRPNIDDNATFWVDRWGAPVRSIGAVYDTSITVRDSITGLVTMARNPVHDSVTATYTSRGNLASITDNTLEGTGTLSTATTSYVYGNSHVPDSPTEIRSPVDTSRFHYDDSLGVADSSIAPGGATVAYSYVSSGPNRGLLASVTALAVRVVDTTYWTRSVQNLVTQVSYDTLGNDTGLTMPSGAHSRTLRDSFGRPYRVDDAGGHRTDLAYDVLNRLRATQVYDSSATYVDSLFYNQSGSLWRTKDPRGVTQEWGYDYADRVVSRRDEAGLYEYYRLNRAGQPDTVQTRMGHKVILRRDAAGRVLSTVYPPMSNEFDLLGANRTLIGDSVVATYDRAGRTLSVARAKDTVAFTWNREGTLRSELQVLRTATGTLTSRFSVSYWGDVGSRTVKMFNGTDTIRYSYGPDAQLAALAVQWGTGGIAADTFRFTWDALGRRDSVVYVGPNAHVSYGYDRDGTLRMVCSRHPNNPYSSDYLEHTLIFGSATPEGFPTSWEERAGGNLDPTNCVPNQPVLLDAASGVSYDARHQILQDATYDYRYDASGNRLSRHFRYNGLFMDSLTYGYARNRLSTLVASSGGPPARDYYFNYNGAEREVYEYGSQTWQVYYYDALGALRGVGSDSALFQYDPIGRRAVGETSAWLGYDGNNVIRDQGGWPQPIWRFVHGPGLDDPLVGLYQEAPPSQFTKYYYLTDGGGRLLAFTAADGSDRLSTPTYTQSGGALAGAITRSRSFDNQRMEVSGAPGLSYYRNRWLDQETGRWTQEDPIGPAGGLNLYAYVGNNPAAFADPFGLWVEPHGVGASLWLQHFLASRSFRHLYGAMFTAFRSRVDYGIYSGNQAFIDHACAGISRTSCTICPEGTDCSTYILDPESLGSAENFLYEFMMAAGSLYGKGLIGPQPGLQASCNSDRGFDCRDLMQRIRDEVNQFNTPGGSSGKTLNPGSGQRKKKGKDAT